AKPVGHNPRRAPPQGPDHEHRQNDGRDNHGLADHAERRDQPAERRDQPAERRDQLAERRGHPAERRGHPWTMPRRAAPPVSIEGTERDLDPYQRAWPGRTSTWTNGPCAAVGEYLPIPPISPCPSRRAAAASTMR